MSFRALDGFMCFSFSLALMCFVCVSSIMNYEDFQKKATTKCQKKKSNKERIKPDNENNDESREE